MDLINYNNELFSAYLKMAELMNQMRDPSQTLGGSVGSIPQSIGSSSANVGGGGSDKSLQALGQGIHSTPASNLKVAEAMRQAKHDGSPSIFSPKMAASKSYTSGLSHSAGAVSNGRYIAKELIDLFFFPFR